MTTVQAIELAIGIPTVAAVLIGVVWMNLVYWREPRKRWEDKTEQERKDDFSGWQW